MRDYDFDYSMIDVMDALGIPRDQIRGSSGNYRCSFCDDKKKHLNINIAGNTFRCNRCPAQGGMLELYARLRGVGLQQAHAEMNAYHSGLPLQTKRRNETVRREAVKQDEAERQQRTRYERHFAYRSMLDRLPLNRGHRRDLIRRGMTDSDIVKLGYKSAPTTGHEKLASELIGLGVSPEHIPGFFKNKAGKWSIYAPFPGYLIPVRGLDGYIGSLQLRLDYGKYLPFYSTNMEGGSKSYGELHFAGDFFGGFLFITEGILKADMIYHLYRRLCPGIRFSVIGLPGAGNLHNIEEVLIELADRGFHTVVEVFDRDKYRNINESVAIGKEKLWTAMERASALWKHPHKLLSLPGDQFLDKGCDDTILILLNQAAMKTN